MLLDLDYSVTFPSTGRKLANKLSFEEGFGAITGPNEAGKSFIIEMVRFCLFGTAALRGKADDYKTLKAKLSFSVKGATYRVERSATTARLIRGDEVIAVGIRPVNQKVVSILGFGLDVFDIACVANQGSIEALGDMKPEARKKMVDSVVGLGVFDEVAKWAGEQATVLNREADAIERTISEPVEPVEPPTYHMIGLYRTEMILVEDAAKRVSEIKGWLAHTKVEPVVPKAPSRIMSTEEIQAKITEKNNILAGIANLERQLKAIPVVGYTSEQIDAQERQWVGYMAWLTREDFLRRNTMPDLTAEEAKAGRDAWKALTTWSFISDLQVRREKLMSAGHNHCPACDHEWPHEHKAIESLDARIAEEIEAAPVRPETIPPKGESYYVKQLDLIEAWDQEGWEEVKDAPRVERPALTKLQIEQAREALKMQEQRTILAQSIAGAKQQIDPTDWTTVLRENLTYEAAVERYQKDFQEWGDWRAEKVANEDELQRLEPIASRFAEFNAAIVAAEVYEENISRYTVERQKYEDHLKEVIDLREKAEQWKKARAALTRLRVLVKQQLVPSLNKVASHLIKGMTCGQRQVITVDEEFEVMVDGQDLSTLSGSGKAVANLALRLGLGQVLTNNIFSIFIGDEIDASMDRDRAEATSETLHSLSSFIKQILLVSHKNPEADYTIELEAI